MVIAGLKDLKSTRLRLFRDLGDAPNVGTYKIWYIPSQSSYGL